jgi:pSer/pThr/pTyr-binding forkhead associated (FHA) protein
MDRIRTSISELVNVEDKRRVLFRNSLTVGRHAFNDLVLCEVEVSTRHAVVEWREGAFFVRDLGSSNGTSRNGRAIRGWQAISEGDVLRFAGVSAWRVESLVRPSEMKLPSAAAETLSPNQQPPPTLRLVLEQSGPGEGRIRLEHHPEDGSTPEILGETQAGQGFVLLSELARAGGRWVDDDALRRALWGRNADRMARSGLHTLVGNIRKILRSWGCVASLIEKETGRTRLTIPPDHVLAH